MLPALGNEFISLLKDTSLVAVIGFEELFRRGQLIVADNYRAFEIYATVALIYLTLTLLASRVFGFLEHRMNPVNKEIGIKKTEPWKLRCLLEAAKQNLELVALPCFLADPDSGLYL